MKENDNHGHTWNFSLCELDPEAFLCLGPIRPERHPHHVALGWGGHRHPCAAGVHHTPSYIGDIVAVADVDKIVVQLGAEAGELNLNKASDVGGDEPTAVDVVEVVGRMVRWGDGQRAVGGHGEVGDAFATCGV